MATKKELVVALAALGVEASEEDYTHDELTDLLREAKDEAQEEEGAPADAGDNLDTVAKVAPGKSVTTRRRGIKGEGEEVHADDFGGGQDAFDNLVEAGVLVP